jgi:hypothetical protein
MKQKYIIHNNFFLSLIYTIEELKWDILIH